MCPAAEGWRYSNTAAPWYSIIQQVTANTAQCWASTAHAALVQRTQHKYSALQHQYSTNTALYSTVQLPSTAAYSSTPVQQASFMCVQCTAQIQHTHSTNTAQIQHKYSTHAIRIQLEFSSIYFTQKGRKTAKRQEELESGIRAYNYTIKYFIAYICYKCTYKV